MPKIISFTAANGPDSANTPTDRFGFGAGDTMTVTFDVGIKEISASPQELFGSSIIITVRLIRKLT